LPYSEILNHSFALRRKVVINLDECYEDRYCKKPATANVDNKKQKQHLQFD